MQNRCDTHKWRAGVIAGLPIACGEVVVSVPDEAVLMVDNSLIAEVTSVAVH